MMRIFFSKKLKSMILCTLCTGALLQAAFATSVPVKCERYTVRIHDHFRVPYNGPYAENFPKGIPFGVGSGLCLKQQRGSGLIEFYTITDRGPNTDGPKYLTGDASSKLFPTPEFAPSLATLRLVRSSQHAAISRACPLKNTDSSESSGLPIPPGVVGSTNEIPLDDAFSLLPFDGNGIDPEGVAVDTNQNFWVCDEYGPFILKYDRRGILLEKYAPGQGLPEVLKHRIPNRGFEGITVAPNGKIYAAVQSVLDINGETSKKALFTRIVELDPSTGSVRMFAYPIDQVYKNAKDAKIGELCAISNTKMLVIEQGKDKNGIMRNLIYLADLTNATDITGVLIGGKEPEYVTKASDLSAAGISIASKTLVVDLRSLGWAFEKAEGLSILPDMKTLAVMNDNDFGIKLVTKDSGNNDVSIADYTLLADGSFVDKNGNPAVLTNSIEPNDEPAELWLIELAQPLQ